MFACLWHILQFSFISQVSSNIKKNESVDEKLTFNSKFNSQTFYNYYRKYVLEKYKPSMWDKLKKNHWQSSFKLHHSCKLNTIFFYWIFHIQPHTTVLKQHYSRCKVKHSKVKKQRWLPVQFHQHVCDDEIPCYFPLCFSVSFITCLSQNILFLWNGMQFALLLQMKC